MSRHWPYYLLDHHGDCMNRSEISSPGVAGDVQDSHWRLRGALLAVWAIASFVLVYFARSFNVVIAGWPLNFWYCSHGAILVFICIAVVYARQRNRGESNAGRISVAAYARTLHRNFAVFVVCVIAFLFAMGAAEKAGLSRGWVGGVFLFASLALYAGIGIYCRTNDSSEYYVAGRRVPAMYNGMATAADWMSAASFISLAGGLFFQGFSGTESHPGGLAFVLGWTGGFCLVALLVAPHLRRLELYTLPDYFALRYGGVWPRRMAALATVLVSFTYLVAQIYGVGLISSRLTGVQFEIGVMFGLGGVLLCSFLGGMRAVTWTQVAQYVILILAFLIPASWLAYKQLGNPLALLNYGQQLERISAMEEALVRSASEQSVVAEYARRAKDFHEKLQNVDENLRHERALALTRLQQLRSEQADSQVIEQATRQLSALPKTPEAARERWSKAERESLERAKPLGGMLPHKQAFAGDPEGDAAAQHQFNQSRNNFLALIFCLMVGTAGLPHLLTRFYTTASVGETRSSVAWSLIFIGLLYAAAPALAVLVKFELLSTLVGQPFGSLPDWINQWAKVDPSLVSVSDVNGDGILQFAELKLGADLIVLATPELGGLPYVISGLVAAGGLAAALSTADGLLLSMGNAFAHDIYFGGDNARANSVNGVILAKFALLFVALAAAFVASQKPAEIISLVATSFSLAASAFVPSLVLGIFWKRANGFSAVLAMVVGLGCTGYYIFSTTPLVRQWLGWSGDGLWFGIQPISAGVFGVSAGTFTLLLAGLTTGSKR